MKIKKIVCLTLACCIATQTLGAFNLPQWLTKLISRTPATVISNTKSVAPEVCTQITTNAAATIAMAPVMAKIMPQVLPSVKQVAISTINNNKSKNMFTSTPALICYGVLSIAAIICCIWKAKKDRKEKAERERKEKEKEKADLANKPKEKTDAEKRLEILRPDARFRAAETVAEKEFLNLCRNYTTGKLPDRFKELYEINKTVNLYDSQTGETAFELSNGKHKLSSALIRRKFTVRTESKLEQEILSKWGTQELEKVIAGERKEKEEKERKEKEEKEDREQKERERIEKAEKKLKEKEERERKEKEEKERKKRDERERIEMERKETERKDIERRKIERKDMAEKKRIEAEKIKAKKEKKEKAEMEKARADDKREIEKTIKHSAILNKYVTEIKTRENSRNENFQDFIKQCEIKLANEKIKLAEEKIKLAEEKRTESFGCYIKEFEEEFEKKQEEKRSEERKQKELARKERIKERKQNKKTS